MNQKPNLSYSAILPGNDWMIMIKQKLERLFIKERQIILSIFDAY